MTERTEETLTSMAKRMGMTVSELADAKPWPAQSVANYAERHGKRSAPIGHQHLSDVQIASAVRMLMRNDLDHESVVCAARDRICALHVEKADLLEALRVIAAASERSETMFGGKMSDVTRVFQNISRVAREAIAKATAQ